MQTKGFINWLVASNGIKSCLHKQNHVIESFMQTPRFLALKFYVGVRVKTNVFCTVQLKYSISDDEKDHKATEVLLLQYNIF